MSENHVILNDLPHDHPMRNTPLGEMETFSRNVQSVTWRPAFTWGIKKNTFNELNETWREFNLFRVKNSSK